MLAVASGHTVSIINSPYAESFQGLLHAPPLLISDVHTRDHSPTNSAAVLARASHHLIIRAGALELCVLHRSCMFSLSFWSACAALCLGIRGGLSATGATLACTEDPALYEGNTLPPFWGTPDAVRRGQQCF